MTHFGIVKREENNKCAPLLGIFQVIRLFMNKKRFNVHTDSLTNFGERRFFLLPALGLLYETILFSSEKTKNDAHHYSKSSFIDRLNRRAAQCIGVPALFIDVST